MEDGKSTILDTNYYYAFGKQGRDAPNAKNNGHSVFGEAMSRQFREVASHTRWNRDLNNARREFLGDYLSEFNSALNESDRIASRASQAIDDFGDQLETMCKGGQVEVEKLKKSMQSFFDSTQQGIVETSKVVKDSLNGISSAASGTVSTSSEGSEEAPKSSEEVMADGIEEGLILSKEQKKALDEFKKLYNNQSRDMTSKEAAIAIAVDQILNLGKKMFDLAKQGRDEAATLYESNMSSVVSRGVMTSKGMQFLPNTIAGQLKAEGLYANLSINDVSKNSVDLMNKGYSAADAISMGMQDAVTKKVAPYLDTQSTAFKDLQNKFGDTFINQVSGINNYVQDIAGSAKVFEANINSIITSLEPIQLWAEKQMWGEEELAALDYLVEQGGMTQTQAASLIQSALKVTTNQYGTITGGSTLEKVAVANGQTDFGSALTSILGTSILASNGNQLAQGAALTALGGTGFISENANIKQLLALYQQGLAKAQSSSKTKEDYAEENYQSLVEGKLTTASERIENLAKNTGSQFAFIKEAFPLFTEQLEKVVDYEKVISSILSIIAIAQARNQVYSALGSAGNIGTGLTSLMTGGVTAASGLAGAGAAAAGAALPIGIGLAVGAGILTVGALIGQKQAQEYNKAESERLTLHDVPSYDIGSSFIPKDQVALVHKGEAVLTPEENKVYQMQKADVSNKLLTGQIAVKIEQQEQNDKLIKVVQYCTEQLVETMKVLNKEKTTYKYDTDTEGLKSSSTNV